MDFIALRGTPNDIDPFCSSDTLEEVQLQKHELLCKHLLNT